MTTAASANSTMPVYSTETHDGHTPTPTSGNCDEYLRQVEEITDMFMLFNDEDADNVLHKVDDLLAAHGGWDHDHAAPLSQTVIAQIRAVVAHELEVSPWSLDDPS